MAHWLDGPSLLWLPSAGAPACFVVAQILATKLHGYSLSGKSRAMRLDAHDHRHACDCAHHQAPAASGANTGLWAALLPALACALCPACLSTFAKVLSVLGIGFGLSEMQHLAVLVMAIGASVGVSAWRSWRTRRVWPIAIALSGTALVLTGHLLGDLPALEWAGVLVLLGGGLTEHFRLRRLRAAAPHEPAHA